MDNTNVSTKYVAVGGYSDTISALNNSGIQRLQHDVAETNRDVKDAEAEIRRDVAKSEADIRYEGAKSEADIRRDTVKVESDLKEFLSVQRNAADAQFLALNNRLCESEKTTMQGDAEIKAEVIKASYEAKLAAKDVQIDSASKFQHLSERLTDKVSHFKEEIEEKLSECCCDQKIATATNTGLLNQLVKALIK